MQRLKSISNRVAARAAVVAGSTLLADGVLQILHSQQNAGSRVVGLAGNLNLALVAIALVAMAPCLIALGRYGRSRVSEISSVVAAAGACLLAIGCVTSIVNQHDLAIFPAIAAFANAAWLLGMLTTAVSLKRGGRVRAAIVYGLPITWIFSIPLATHGGCVLSGAYFLAVGHLLATHRLDRRGAAQLAAAGV
jgi:hypothetical protein